MSMDDKSLFKISRDFRSISSRYLNTKYGTEQQDLKRFLTFIDDTPIIKDYLDECVQEIIDIKEVIANKSWNDKFNLPLQEKEEVSFIYQLLKYMNDNNNFLGAISGYRVGKKIQSNIDAFNNQVVLHLINHIREHLEDMIYGVESLKPGVIEPENPKVFLSYSWADKMFADFIDEALGEMGIILKRDERDIAFKESLKEFMESIGKHDFVISIISDNYLKSVNCMYEIYEVMRDREYKDKMLLIILDESDSTLIENIHSEQSNFSADIYDIHSRIKYITFWEQKQNELEETIDTIQDQINKVEPLAELRRLKNISSNISEFLDDISDWKNVSLTELNESGFKKFLDIIYQKI